MPMWTEWHAYDQYFYAAAAFFGTVIGALALLWIVERPRWQSLIAGFEGVAPPFINILGVLFALTLAFLANDTWSAHDHAIDAVNREADSLRSIQTLAGTMQSAQAAQTRAAVDAYARASVAEWPLLAQRATSSSAAIRADQLLGTIASPSISATLPSPVTAALLELAIKVRDNREARIALSQTHVNPFKWLGMAFLGFVTMVSVAVVHIGKPRAALVSILLFAAASAPTATIVLVHGNPFQAPAAVSMEPIAALVQKH